jgi:hypothetical protein
MAAARSLDDRDFVFGRPIDAMDDVELRYIAQQLRIRELDAFEHLRHEIGRIVDEFFHGRPR